MNITLLYAQSLNFVIGDKGGLPWNVPEELQHFKRTTKGHTVVMGRTTWEGPGINKRPLPERSNVILTKDRNYTAPGCTIIHTPTDLLATKHLFGSEVFVIGGTETLSTFIHLATKVIVTTLMVKCSGDALSPYLGNYQWLDYKTEFSSNESNIQFRIDYYRKVFE